MYPAPRHRNWIECMIFCFATTIFTRSTNFGRIRPVRGLSVEKNSWKAYASTSSTGRNTMTSTAAPGNNKSDNSNKPKLVFHWFRHGDLRVHDNPALAASNQLAQESRGYVVPIFCYDTRNFFGDRARTEPFGSLKCGPKRAKFILESVADLKQTLRGAGCDMIAAVGAPAAVFDSLVTRLKHSDTQMEVCIVCQEEVVKEEKDAVKAVQSVLQRHFPRARPIRQVWGSTMYNLQDLPFDANLQNMPDVFTPFRNQVEKNCKIDQPLPPPTAGTRKLRLPPQDSVEYKVIEEWLNKPMPNGSDLGYTPEQVAQAKSYDPRSVMPFKGGETAALERVKDYIWTKDLLKDYFDTRNGMLGADYSTKLSPWLAHGNVSPRYVAQQCRLYERERVANKSTYWVVFELLWRDFCKFFAAKHGDKIFFLGGTVENYDKQWSTYEKNLQAWIDGMTGYPLVDANMRELKASGFMSNRGRQNVASFLTIDLNYDWRYGGDYFESNLIDYDVYSNWVNWCSAAGMTGGRLNRFNIVKQSKDYDQHGDYVRHWIPELKNVPKEFVHEPWKMTQFQQMEYGCKLGVDYPNPIIPPSGGGGGGGNRDNGRKGGEGGGRGGKQRKPNNNKKNKHQQYEMKSLKQGGYQIKG